MLDQYFANGFFNRYDLSLIKMSRYQRILNYLINNRLNIVRHKFSREYYHRSFQLTHARRPFELFRARPSAFLRIAGNALRTLNLSFGLPAKKPNSQLQ